MKNHTPFGPLAAFQVRSFRFQWPADLLTSWAFEMETLILGWFVLVETGSVLLLSLFGALQYLGTLVAPMMGSAGDQMGRRVIMCSTRGFLAFLATVIMALGLLDSLNATVVLAIALIGGMIKPSDIVMRNALIGDTMPGERLANALGLSRTTMDSARIVGALTGAGLFSVLGIGYAYIAVTGFYVLSFLFTLGVSRGTPDYSGTRERASQWIELKDGLRFIQTTPVLLAIILWAFFINVTAFPISHGLMPFIAKEIYGLDENGLGQLIAGFAAGALTGSIIMAVIGARGHSGYLSLSGILGWYICLATFIQYDTKLAGFTVLFIMGICHSFGMISMSVLLLDATESRFRGRVMGVRMLAVYGLPVGLLASGGLIEWIGFRATASLYIVAGVLLTLYTVWRWRHAFWR
ncbi:MAG: MFS transporter [Pseudomonadota bacterium]|nr:MFS transporter [Pseudomonadota bacterium]